MAMRMVMLIAVMTMIMSSADDDGHGGHEDHVVDDGERHHKHGHLQNLLFILERSRTFCLHTN